MKVQLITIAFVLAILKIFAQEGFGNRIDKGLIENDQIDEASGMDASQKNANVLWVHNDSGDLNRIFALNTSGKNLGTYYINGVTNRDWEDISVGTGPEIGKDYIYIGDIGDNDAKYDIKYIYRVLEPKVDTLQEAVTDTIYGVETISFRFPDGMRDAETLMIDSATKDIYIVSKREDSVRVYLAAYPQSTTEVITLEKLAVLGFSFAVGGDISSDGQEILIKNYSNVFYWKRNGEQNLWEVFENEPDTLPYIFDISQPLGESIAWAYDGGGYFTTNEETPASEAHLYFYPRIKTTSVIEEKTIDGFKLNQNYPNPFNPTTVISWQLAVRSHVTLKVYDLLGNEVAALVDGYKSAGNYETEFDGSNPANGGSISSGVYFYKLSAAGEAGNYSITRKMIILR